ncbi:MAG: restriction endonuclease subunit S [Anaerolineaceae bacterium]|nr:restriction endonuclease subunit S [Anaerolineaceae bacterium]
MNHTVHNNIVSFIWGIADDVLRDVYVRGKYRDVILPMTVIRRLDILLEPTKDEVLKMHQFLEENQIETGIAQFRPITKYPFYNTSPFTLQRLYDTPSQIKANFAAYLNGFSDNVQEIIRKFKFHNQLETLDDANRLYPLLEKFLSPRMNLGVHPVKDGRGNILHHGLSNLGMGYVFEELIRRFNEENNEEAGEHFTPRDIIQLMVHLLFEPIADQIESGTYLVYDGACGSGGMLTEAEKFFLQLASQRGKRVSLELYGQEVNPETYAICTADMLIQGRSSENIAFGSTLRHDAFMRMLYDFMLSNPPYGKSWSVDKEFIYDGKKKEVIDHRFTVGLPRSSDGQLLFLVNMLTKMKDTPRGSRIAHVHNGSALFTGDAGQGESEIRKWIIENDWLEAIIGLPLNMFYNTGIATYIWVLTNRKPEHRKGKVQLIDGRELYTKLRKNLGSKNCEFTDNHIRTLMDTFLNFEESDISQIFTNEDFGYHKITVERPLRLKTHVTPERLATFKHEAPKNLQPLGDAIANVLGNEVYDDFNVVRRLIRDRLKDSPVKVTKAKLNKVLDYFSERDPEAVAVLRRVPKKAEIELLKDRSAAGLTWQQRADLFEADSSLRDTENVPLTETIESYFAREVLPHVPDAWIDESKTVRGYEISFTKYFYRYEPLRSLDEILVDIQALEAETDGILEQIVSGQRA